MLFPYVNTIDDFILNFTFAPIVSFSLGVFLIKCYPSLKQWSTARSDTTVILGSTFGLLSATTIMNQMGLLERPLTPPIYSIIAPDLGLCILRTIIGLIIIYATRQIVKTFVLRSTCSFYGLDWKNPEIKRFAQVEMPYYYLTYFAIGFNIAFTCPLAFRAMGINRDYSYTEL
jgi:sphingosine-1-phosphate phosphatase 1